MAVHARLSATFDAIPWEMHDQWYHKWNVAYMKQANALQTLDISIPDPRVFQSGIRSATVAGTSTGYGVWVIYVHGGAWRDPEVDSSSFEATQTALLSRMSSDPDWIQRRGCIAGLASINYSLSPHPNHPAPPDEPSRNAFHPQHIHDVLCAIAYLQGLFKFGSRYLLVGHSCGATLAFQTVMNYAPWFGTDIDIPEINQPYGIIGVNGLYDLVELAHRPGQMHQHLVPLYQEFLRAAFGNAEETWTTVSPASASDGETWSVGRLVILAQSKEDTLVPWEQTEQMTMSALIERLKSSVGCVNSEVENRAVRVVELSGDHNEVWETGDQLVDLIRIALDSPV